MPAPPRTSIPWTFLARGPGPRGSANPPPPYPPLRTTTARFGLCAYTPNYHHHNEWIVSAKHFIMHVKVSTLAGNGWYGAMNKSSCGSGGPSPSIVAPAVPRQSKHEAPQPDKPPNRCLCGISLTSAADRLALPYVVVKAPARRLQLAPVCGGQL